MERNERNVLYLIIGFLAMALFATLVQYYGQSDKIIYQKGNERIIRDTVWRDSLIVKQPIHIVSKGEIVYETEFDTLRIRDSLIQVPIFTAETDTISGDTFKMKYQYPVNKFTLDIRKQPDTLRTRLINNDITKIEEEKFYNSLWFRFSTFFVGIIGGILLK